MVISHLLGGLGNQMFQYAAGRALALARGTTLLVDIGDIVSLNQHQGFELQRVFHCPINLAKTAEVFSVLGWQSSKRLRAILKLPLLSTLRSRHLVMEPHFNYWPGIRNIAPPIYIIGYWQSERYFSDIADVIRSDFTFRRPLCSHNLKLEEQILDENSVSLHVRRGDYVSNTQALSTHGVCHQDYYEKAIQYIEERVSNPIFYVFSDEIDWVRSHLPINHPCHYVENNRGLDSYIDMQLMSRCKHNIVANSSFSWWGAWLNSNSSKIVIAPEQWFANGTNTCDLLPPAWVTL